jgi:hypothetical protein
MVVLAKRYTALEAWPADAQLGLLILAWALGSGFQLKDFASSVNRMLPRWGAAARAVGPGRVPAAISIGAAVRMCFRNAVVVTRWNLNEAHLFYPEDLSTRVGASML